MRIDFKKVLEDKGLKVGDNIEFSNHFLGVHNPYKIVYKENGQAVLRNDEKDYELTAYLLCDYEWKKVKPKKKVGDLNCGDSYCDDCPLRGLDCAGTSQDTIRQNWEITLQQFPYLAPMREYVGKELDKEVLLNDQI